MHVQLFSALNSRERDRERGGGVLMERGGREGGREGGKEGGKEGGREGEILFALTYV